jgi:hypothetical protein
MIFEICSSYIYIYIYIDALELGSNDSSDFGTIAAGSGSEP